MGWNDEMIEQFRAGEGPHLERFGTQNLVLLHTTGARSGQERVSPLACFREDGRLVVVASFMGRDENPAWYYNLVANPKVTVEVYDDDQLSTIEAQATVADPERRAELWPRIIAAMPGFADYEKKTDRVIPVIELTPGAGPGGHGDAG